MTNRHLWTFYELVIDDSKSVQQSFGCFSNADIVSFTFDVNAASEDRITVHRMPLPPSALKADAKLSGTLITRLSWNPGSDSNVTGYNIYSREEDESSLSLL